MRNKTVKTITTVAGKGTLHGFTDWLNAPLIDATSDLMVEISNADIVLGKAECDACPLALSGRKRFPYFAVGVDVVHVGVYIKKKPFRVRYRSGYFPRRYDKALKEMADDLTKTFPQLGIKPQTYRLRKPSVTQTLEAKKKNNEAYIKKLIGGHQPTKRSVSKRSVTTGEYARGILAS